MLVTQNPSSLSLSATLLYTRNPLARPFNYFKIVAMCVCAYVSPQLSLHVHLTSSPFILYIRLPKTLKEGALYKSLICCT